MKHDSRPLLSILTTTSEERALRVSEPELTSTVWWRETFLRVAVLLVLAMGIEYVLGFGPLRVVAETDPLPAPHPYWLIVLPLAASRGLAAGLAAAIVATAVMVGGTAWGAAGWGGLTLDRDTLHLPIQFFFVAILVGELRDAIRDRVRELRRQLIDVKGDLNASRYERDVLASSVKELERRLAKSPRDLRSVIDANRRADTGSVAVLFSAGLDLAVEHAGGGVSIYEVDDAGALRLACSTERTPEQGAPEPTSITKTAIASATGVSAFDSPDHEFPTGPIMAAPIVGPTGSVVGLVCLDTLEPERLAPSTLPLLESVAEWISHGLTRMGVQDAPADAPIEATGQVFPTPQPAIHLMSRLHRELLRCRRHGLHLSVVEWMPQRGSTTREGLLTELGPLIRSTDTAFALSDSGGLMLLLVGADAAGVAAASRRIEDMSRELDAASGSSSTVRTLVSDDGSMPPSTVMETLERALGTEMEGRDNRGSAAGTEAGVHSEGLGE